VEYPAILKQSEGFERLVVENHASLLNSSKTQQLVRRFRDGMEGELELALGLESIEANAMGWLNKSMSLEQFQAALEFLRSEQIFIRVFVLLQPMGTPIDESVDWAVASCQAAARWGAQRISLIPTRAGNGFMEDLASRGRPLGLGFDLGDLFALRPIPSGTYAADEQHAATRSIRNQATLRMRSPVLHMISCVFSYSMAV
jgi:hypothetical protein